MEKNLSSEVVGCKACEDFAETYVRISNRSVTRQTAAYDGKFSVIIPLYNKEREIGRALRSVLAQTLPPMEIIVVDDGSTDGGAAVVEHLMAEIGPVVESFNSQLIKLIRQPNAGETAARNRGMAEATGTHFALLDADDEWRPGFLAAVAGLIRDFPGAGLYCTGFEVARGGRVAPGRTPLERGVVRDYFAAATGRFVATASSAVLPRDVVAAVGGFPEGMRLGGDQYMWTKIALARPVVFTPERLAIVHASGANRSAAIYTPETTKYSFSDFYDPGPAPANPALNRYVARVALGKAISATVRGGTQEGLRAEREFAPGRRSSPGSSPATSSHDDSGYPATSSPPDSGNPAPGSGSPTPDSGNRSPDDSGNRPCQGDQNGTDRNSGNPAPTLGSGNPALTPDSGSPTPGSGNRGPGESGNRRLWWRLWVLNRLPRALRPALNGLYTALAWHLLRKGF